MPEIPPGLILKTSTPKGRTLVAAELFAPGDLIAQFSKPSIAIPDSLHLDQTCNHCLSVTAKVRACAGCKTVAYCGPACQKADWALVHKGECKVFQRVRAEGHDILPTPVRALVQMLLRNDMLDAAREMESHADHFRAQGGKTLDDFQLQAMAALHYGGREANAENLGMAMQLLFELQINSFNRYDQDVGQTGLFINPALALVNHSCVPNAFVQFIGRKAVLRAYQAIKKDDEVLISYIDCTLHRHTRQEALKSRYHFDCLCPRCKDALDVYQVCQQYPHLELNSFSLTPDLDILRNPAVQESFHASKSLQQTVEQIYPICAKPLVRADSSDDARQVIRQRWKLCQPLREAKLFAIEPLARMLVEASIYFGERRNFPYSLALYCFIARCSDPFRFPMPFGACRVKGLVMMAKILSNTLMQPASAPPNTDDSVGARLARALATMDQATMAQAVLVMAVRYGPMAHSEEWQVCQEATQMLKDLLMLPSREKENSLMRAWAKDQEDLEGRMFFEQAVLDPIKTLAGFALEIMGVEFES